MSYMDYGLRPLVLNFPSLNTSSSLPGPLAARRPFAIPLPRAPQKGNSKTDISMGRK